MATSFDPIIRSSSRPWHKNLKHVLKLKASVGHAPFT